MNKQLDKEVLGDKSEGLLIHSIQLWEQITKKKAPYTVKHIDSSHRISEKEAIWIRNMLKVIEDWNPEAHRYRRFRAKYIGNYFEKIF